MNAENTGSFIAGLRKEQGLTQKQLADRLLVSDKAISRWETGHGMPDLDNLEALAGVLEVSIAELLRGERIIEAVPADDAESLAHEGLSLFREALRRRTTSNVLLGFLAGLIVVVLLVVHLTAPIAIPYREGIARVDELSDGTLVAISEQGAAGVELDIVGNETFITLYDTRWNQLTRDARKLVAVVGSIDQTEAVLYYPGASGDVLLYGQLHDAGVVTLPRLVYNMWLMAGIAASIIGLAAYVLLRKRWYAKHILKAALLPVCFSVSLIAVLWGRFDQVYNAAFYLSGICIVALALYALAFFLVSTKKGVPLSGVHQKGSTP